MTIYIYNLESHYVAQAGLGLGFKVGRSLLVNSLRYSTSRQGRCGKQSDFNH